MTLTNGTDEAIQLLVNTFVDDNDEVLILRPSYAMYRFYSELAGASVSSVDYRPEKLAFPLEELLGPHYSGYAGHLDQQSEQSHRDRYHRCGAGEDSRHAPNAAVFVDEAYYEFCGVTMLPLIKQYSNLFVSRTFSKIYGMAALRCGCLFSQAANMAFIRKAQSPYSVNMMAAMAARIAVQDRRFVEEYVARSAGCARTALCRFGETRHPLRRKPG